MEIVAKDLITGGILTLAITIGASWSTIKIGLSSNKDDIGKIHSSIMPFTDTRIRKKIPATIIESTPALVFS